MYSLISQVRPALIGMLPLANAAGANLCGVVVALPNDEVAMKLRL